MNRLKEFKDFQNLNESSLNEANSSDLDKIRTLISDLVLKTKNNPDEKNIAECSDAIIDILGKNPANFFGFFSDVYGIGSMPTLEIFMYAFKKYGFLNKNLNPNICKNLEQTSEDFFDDQQRIVETFKDAQSYKKFQKLLNYIPSQEKINYHAENISKMKEIMEKVKEVLNCVNAISQDNPNILNPKDKEFLADCGLDFISDFGNASKLKEQSPKIYEFISESGEGVDTFSTLGDLGF